jgi:hypothetical protein
MSDAPVLQMNGANGAAAYPLQAWLNQTVQQFFGSINWADHPPELQRLQLTAHLDQSQSLNLLTVNQFFNAINWEGNPVTPLNSLGEPISDSEVDTVTLEDFFELF